MKKFGAIAIVLATLASIPLAGVIYLMMLLTATSSSSISASICDKDVSASTSTSTSSTTTASPSQKLDVEKVTSGSVAGWNHEQLVNAAHIINAARAMDLNTAAQVIGVMTAMGESSLINISYGDWETSGVKNPDGSPTTSIGLFQQQDGWGSTTLRMDPEYSATLFFEALIKVDSWETLEPTIAAHRTQGNSDPYHYEPFFADATEVVTALTGIPLMTTTDTTTSTIDVELELCVVGASGEFPAASGTAPGPWGGYGNGQIPSSQLGSVPWDGKHKLRTDALEALVLLDRKFVADFGYHLPINDGYRSYEQQVEAKAKYGNEAATPGTSNHGWALAIDIGDQQHWRIAFGSEIYTWLQNNAPAYGWVHPAWAEQGNPGGPDEAWHWEYWGKEA